MGGAVEDLARVSAGAALFGYLIRYLRKRMATDAEVDDLLQHALVKAMRLQEKAKQVGFEWENAQQVWEKVEEEMQEFKKEFNAEADESIDREKAMAEFGDLLFSLVNYARFINIDPEEALERTNKKFIKRFQFLESESAKDGKKMGEMSLDEMDVYWNRAKKL